MDQIYGEINNTDIKKFWKFINVFTKPLIEMKQDSLIDGNITFYTWNNTNFDVQDYRVYIIDAIKEKYTIDEFYFYEQILNILYWKLKKKLKNSVSNNKNNITVLNKQDIDIKTLQSKTNSYIQYNEVKNQYYSLNKISDLDTICMNLFTDRKDFEYYFINSSKINKYDKRYIMYYNLNYPFPNVNPMFFNKNSEKYCIRKITNMYYKRDDKYWYKLI